MMALGQAPERGLTRSGGRAAVSAGASADPTDALDLDVAWAALSRAVQRLLEGQMQRERECPSTAQARPQWG